MATEQHTMPRAVVGGEEMGYVWFFFSFLTVMLALEHFLENNTFLECNYKTQTNKMQIF